MDRPSRNIPVNGVWKGLDRTQGMYDKCNKSLGGNKAAFHMQILSYANSPAIILLTDPDAAQANKNHQDVRSYVRQLNVIDNQRTLSQMSHRLEPRRP